MEVVGDVSQPDIQKALLAACANPDILVNNNGGPPRRDFAELNRAQILEGVTNNMVTPLELIQAVIGGMAERGFGRIVNITSLSVYVPIPGLDVSSGARAGLTAFLAGVARTVAHRNVTINNLLPGKLDTDRLRGASRAGQGLSEEEKRAGLLADIPAKRLGTPEEFGQICAFFCSVHAGYLTGQNIPVDGGSYVSAF
jgi:3-oxoacyl-[acyl-carrier protein] reductase